MFYQSPPLACILEEGTLMHAQMPFTPKQVIILGHHNMPAGFGSAQESPQPSPSFKCLLLANATDCH